jgi:hypothetical protein
MYQVHSVSPHPEKLKKKDLKTPSVSKRRSVGWLDRWMTNGKLCGRKRSWLIIKVLCRQLPGEIEQNHESLSQNSRCSDQAMNQALIECVSWRTSVGIATSLRAGRQRSVGSISGRTRDVSILHNTQTAFGAHPASYPVGTVGYFFGGKSAGAWSWPLTSDNCRGKKYVDIYLHFPISLRVVVLN